MAWPFNWTNLNPLNIRILALCQLCLKLAQWFWREKNEHVKRTDGQTMDNRRPENFTWAFCLFVWGFSSYSRIFYSYGDVTITGEGLQILTFARHSWPLFVCLSGIFRPTREFFTHSETSPMPVKGCNFDFCSALMAIEQLGFLSVPHLLWHVASFCNAHLRETDTHSCCTAFGSGAVTTIFYDLGLSRLGFENPTYHLLRWVKTIKSMNTPKIAMGKWRNHYYSRTPDSKVYEFHN